MVEIIKKYKSIFIVAVLAIFCGGIYFICFFKDELANVEIIEIDKIYIYHSGMGWTTEEYKIDFVEKTFWEYHTGIFERYVKRNPEAENEGFVLTAYLTDEEIAEFMKKSSYYGVHTWEEEYKNEGIADGHQWGMTIYYKDGTVKKIWGSNAYPKNWDKMREEFLNLTGVNVI